MMNSLTHHDILLLRSRLDEALKEMSQQPQDKLSLPEEKGGAPTDTVTLIELLLTTLSSLAKATGKLRGSDMAVDMSSKPLEMKFTGTITRFSKEEGEIYLKLEL